MSDLFAWKGQPRAHARATDPRTSLEAADSVNRIRESQKRILEALKTYGPMTDEQILALNLGLSPSGTRSRRAELVERGYVKDSGRKDKTASGRNTIVWEAI